MAIPEIIAVEDHPDAFSPSSPWDAVVVVSPTFTLPDRTEIHTAAHRTARIDARVGKDVLLIHVPSIAGERLVLAPTGPIDRDYDDVRRFGEASMAGVRRARDAGARRPLLLVPRIPLEPGFERTLEVAILGALGGLWEPPGARDPSSTLKAEPVQKLGVVTAGSSEVDAAINTALALESGRRFARDLTIGGPERMSPEEFARQCEERFADTCVTVEVVSDPLVLKCDYPLLTAVGRASEANQKPRVVRLEYSGSGHIDETILLAGKGLTFDSGGVDLKGAGQKSGMSRDKAGAASVAGLFAVLDAIRPERLRVIAELGLARNDVGPGGYVPDEIVTSHAGVRVRITHTDAEGRLVLADLLSHLRLKAAQATHPSIVSLATLTGHASRYAGPYTVVVENGPARKFKLGSGLAALGDLWGDPLEVSRLRREDYAIIDPYSKLEDAVQATDEAAATTARGHQFPLAFLLRASGLEKHGNHSRLPIPVVHLDMTGSACEAGDLARGLPTGAAVISLAARWVLDV